MSGWSFPKITELRLDREIAKQADAVAHLLKHSGDDLRSVIFGHSNMGKTSPIQEVAVGELSRR
jgi:hypothetical protein